MNPLFLLLLLLVGGCAKEKPERTPVFKYICRDNPRTEGDWQLLNFPESCELKKSLNFYDGKLDGCKDVLISIGTAEVQKHQEEKISYDNFE